MASTTHSNFDANTEGIAVTAAFPDGVRGKNVIVTGVNVIGLGFSAAHAIASQSPANLIITGRSSDKLHASIEALKKDFPAVSYRILLLDLSSQKSVRKAAEQVLAWDDVPAIHTVINSAGVMGIQKRTLSEDGIELHFATNHIGHWLLSCLIMPKLIKATETSPRGSVRIVNVSSRSPTVASMRWSDMNFDTINNQLPQEEQPPYEFLKVWGYKDSENVAYIPLDGYNRSKVANVLFGIEANTRLFEKHGIFTTAVHPGVIFTELSRDFPQETMDSIAEMMGNGFFTPKSLAAGSSTALVAALDPKVADGVGQTVEGSENYGAFLMDCQISDKATPLAVSSSEAKRLWELSEQLVGQKFSW